MRILWVKANKLLPVHSGGDIRSFHIARHLSVHDELLFLSYYDGPPDEGYEQELRACFPSAVCVCTGKLVGTLARAVDYIWRLPQQVAYAVSRFDCSQVRNKLNSWFEERCFDVAVCDFLDAAINFPETLSIPTVLFQHNVESDIWQRHVATEHNSARRLLYTIEYRKMLAYERRMVREFDHVIAVSEHDRQLMAAWVDPSRISVVPTGVDLSQYRPEPGAAIDSALVVFIGAMDWEPNVDAVEFFCTEIWPSVLSDIPNARFRIVGRNPGRRVLKFQSSSVEVTGRVSSVIDHLRSAAAVVVPLRIGGGTRLKIYEAMACGKAIVSTLVGAEGLDVHNGKDILLVDNARAFTEALLMVLKNADIRRRYEQAAAELAARYDWLAVAQNFGEVLEQVVTSGSTRAQVARETRVTNRVQL